MAEIMGKKSVTVIPAVCAAYREQPSSPRRRRVAGYARVSTELEEQQSSYAAQIDYYENLIQSRADWEFAGIYTDEGISATNTRGRDGFNSMISDALDGKIDLIITKSVSRFARNTVDSLSTIRKLKEIGVEVYFEKENIRTLDSSGELLITIMSSLAQEESRSISENVTWGHRKRFADGKVSVAYSTFLGYEKGKDGALAVNEKEAQTVREIFRLYIGGMSEYSIAKTLSERGILTPSGKKKWCISTISSILQNEKYKGDALLQKSYTVDFLTKRKKKNKGEVPQYYVENSHEAIITREVFERAQDERRQRHENFLRGKRERFAGVSEFSGKIFCGDCGYFYRPKFCGRSAEKGKIVFQCGRKYKNKVRCSTANISEGEMREMFKKAEKTGGAVKKAEILARGEVIFYFEGGTSARIKLQ